MQPLGAYGRTKAASERCVRAAPPAIALKPVGLKLLVLTGTGAEPGFADLPDSLKPVAEAARPLYERLARHKLATL